MGYVFISYSSKDREIADKISHIFSRNGIDSWIAPDDIPAGSEYAGVINKAIKNCACLVLLLTGDSMGSPWVAKEVERAIHYKKPVIPVQLETVSLTDQFELYISTNQILSLPEVDEESEEMQHLITVVQRLAATSDYEKEALTADIMRGTTATKGNITKPQKSKNDQINKSRLALIIIAILCGILAITLLITLLSNASDENNNREDVPAITEQTPSIEQIPDPSEEQTQEHTQNVPTEEETTAPSGVNEIPSVYEEKITKLKESSDLTLRNSTIRVKVGQSLIPPAAQIWTSAKLYSQDTSIAVGDDNAIKGISKGETYVIVESSLGLTQAYYVIVE